MFTRNALLHSVALFVTLFGIVCFWKPGFLFFPNGSLRSFGLGYRNKTILPLWLFSLVLGLSCYLGVLYGYRFLLPPYRIFAPALHGGSGPGGSNDPDGYDVDDYDDSV